jgi:nitrate/nitrite transporter NarK
MNETDDSHAASVDRSLPRVRTEDLGWQRTLWAMVGIQFVMTAAMSFLSPIIPLMLPQLGVTNLEGVYVWAGVINGSTSFVAAFASPLWGRVADKHGRKLSLLRSSFAIGIFTALMGLATNVWWFFGARAVMVHLRDFRPRPSPSSPARRRSGDWATPSGGSRPVSWPDR